MTVVGRREKARPGYTRGMQYDVPDGKHLRKGEYDFKCPVTGISIHGSRKFGDYLYELVTTQKKQLDDLQARAAGADPRYKAAWEDLTFLLASLNGNGTPEAAAKAVASVKARHGL